MDLNYVTLTGTLARGPITRVTDQSTSQMNFTLRVTEAGPAGQAFTLFVPCEAYGHAGEAAGKLTAGEAVLVAGKLKWTSWTDKHGQKRTSLCVLARLVKRLAPAGVPGGPHVMHERRSDRARLRWRQARPQGPSMTP